MIDLPLYKNENLSFEERAKDMVSNMTLFEKVSQMTYNSAAVPRLGISSYNWWNEALHGVARAGVATMFPQAIGMAATFDEKLIYEVAGVISTEGRAKYHEYQRKGDHDIYKGLTFWSPNINIFRDPRWGRGHETYGEDPYLTGRLGVAFIKGLQGNEKYMKSAACAKHFAVHSGPEAERHSFNAVVSKKDLRETYLPAFKDAVVEAKVEAVMGAYNRTNDEPCCGSKALLSVILREEWDFKGHVVSDCWAIKDFHENHRITSNAVESVALAVNNGCDLNCGNMYLNVLIACKEGLVLEETIDKSVERLITTRMKLGMFDNPRVVPYTSIPYEENDSKQHRDFALKVSEKTMVLLKNENNILPLNKDNINSIAVIGPNANSRDALIGNYFGTASKYVTVLEGIQQAVKSNTRVYYAQGCHLHKDKVEDLAMKNDRISEAISVAERSDLIVMCLGFDATIEGEEGDEGNIYAAGDKNNLNLPGLQQKLLEEVYKTGKPVILVLASGSALAVNFADEHIPAIIQAWYSGAQGGKAISSLIFGDYSPSGKLPVTFYKTTEELPDFIDYSMKNRTYRYMENEALYPFGYGLSYTKFEYSNLVISKDEVKSGESVKFKITVKNIGERESYETVQLYLKDVDSSVITPKYELKGIKKINLKVGQEKQVDFELTSRQMALIDNDGNCILEPGIFQAFVGGSQPDHRSIELMETDVEKCTFEVKGEILQLEY
ncbi:glycoside hydrolase family 3 C-terminal domain-containing protein [Clostridium sp.]|jgi:beta-glucosidase|uniref:glycoside hydrolase family 3 C-terminal domain-containing protein n=1 Tax=Clostridium sp. TaxID=1506 RepID=UPI003EEE614A